ncbi:exodeoxyribonuclease V subunit gamma [Klebsiella sp. BIGb0407]|uniref:exodeoxyribonuclease V subunit gamma n=1 Tax=Klebsiella sp. BIGb0407 TaxID=2940603 RepID=UPI0021690F17|nr:exodeoxyribonuclease V subunit gamma [Klebsiella sp. BIGb0407]MCS3430948.1 exodeoxyribonuclease V gamma subunit [Klebsiella sp. BIGb0407]
MLRVYHSNRLDVLEEIMEFIVERQPLADVLEPEVVLVQSTGMAQWLQMTLAQKFGIAANIQFPLPASFIWEMFSCVLPGIPEQSAFNKQSMSWKLMALIPDMLSEAPFAQLKHYLQEDDNNRKLFQLASRIADLYDQYLVYRPGWLSRWEKGEWIDNAGEAQQWQAPLWAALVRYTADLGHPQWHRANLYQRFIKVLEESDTCPPGLPSRIFLCGISALPPVYLQALQALGRHIDIHVLFTNPCRYYWGDIKDSAFLARLTQRRRRRHLADNEHGLFKNNDSAAALFNTLGEQDTANPLLASWGKLGRDYVYLLSELEQFEEIDVFVDIEPDNLLHKLQYDLLELKNSAVLGLTEEEFNRSDNKQQLDPDDSSVTFHECHSPQREVEILHDKLLAMLQDDPNLKPRDIIVMVADIDSYSPFIQAVFGNARDDRWLPFTLSDRRASHAHPALQAFISLLSLPESRFLAEDVLALLEVSSLASRFSIDEEGLRYLRQWVSESGIRWGLDDDNVRQQELPATGQHTWRFGLTRMLLGYAMESEAGVWDSVLPFDESSGLIAKLVGQLAELLMRLNQWRQVLAEPRSLEEWLPLCKEMLACFFQADDESEEALALIESQWQEMIEQGVQAAYNQPVSLVLLRSALSQRLDNQRMSQRFLAGQVNFCTLMPMRAIPFKVVCLLGMNDGVYPRTLAPLGFDLISQNPQRGDRSRRDDDRYLFLEALSSAERRLYISYIGRSIQDNSRRYPSVLVEELLDYIVNSHYLPGDEQLDIDASSERVKRHLIVQHSRTPFASDNYLPEDAAQSFAEEWLSAANQQGEAHAPFIVEPLPVIPFDEISLEQLQRFWRHPVRAFFQTRLGVNFRLDETELPDSEPFTLDSLESFLLNQKVLNTLIEQDDPQQLFTRYRAAGELPYGAFGEIIWEKQQAEMQILAEKIIAARQPTENWEVDLSIAGVRFTGWLSDVQPQGLLRWRPSILTVGHGLQLWLEHLVWSASGGRGESCMYGRKDSEWRFPLMEKDQAYHYLEQLIEGYKKGVNQPLILLPQSGGVWLKACFDPQQDAILWDEQTQLKARSKLVSSWEGNTLVEGEGADIWLQRLHRSLDESYYKAIISEAENYLLPVFRFNQS